MPEISNPSGQMEAESRELHAQIARWKYALPIIAAALAAAYVIYFWTLPRTNDPDKWGTFGDYFGGLMNPLVAFAAFYWLTQSVKLQKKELAETKAALVESASAQTLLVENGRLAVRLSALTALVNAANDEVADAVQAMANLKRSQTHIRAEDNTAERQQSYQAARIDASRRIDAVRQMRDGYLAEMRQILIENHTVPAPNPSPPL